MNWTWDELFLVSWTVTSNTIKFRCAVSCKKQLDIILTSCPGRWLVMNHGCTIMTWKQSSNLHNVRRRPLRDWKKARQVCSNIESMLIFFIFFFNIWGIVHKEFVPPGRTVNGNLLLRGFEMTEGKREAPTAWDVEERRLVVAPWQCACTHLAREGILDKK